MAQYHFVHGIFALLLGICSTSLLAEDTRPPDAIPPRASVIVPLTLTVVADVNKSTGEITFNNTVWRPIVTTQRGQDGVSIRTVHYVPDIKTTKRPLARCSLYDVKGNKLTVNAFMGRVKTADVIVFMKYGPLPDIKYFRVFKDDTLILMGGNSNATPSDPIITDPIITDPIMPLNSR